MYYLGYIIFYSSSTYVYVKNKISLPASYYINKKLKYDLEAQSMRDMLQD